MYYIYGVSGPSLLIESTNSIIIIITGVFNLKLVPIFAISVTVHSQVWSNELHDEWITDNYDCELH